MSEYGLFWNSKNGDRKYTADDFEEWLRKFFTTGVFNGELQVTATSGMGVAVSAGYCNVNGKVMFFPSARGFTLDVAYPSVTRVDTDVIERNDPDRTIYMKIVKGDTDGVAKAPVRENGVYQLVLAQITVNAGATSISQVDIRDTRSISALCGYVVSTVTHIDFDSAYAQFTAWFNDYKETIIHEFDDAGAMAQLIFESWFENIRGQLDEDAAGHLQLEIDDINKEIAILDAEESLATCAITFSADGNTITTTYNDKLKTTVFNNDGSITETLQNAVTTARLYRRVTTFNADGSIYVDVSR